MLESAVTLVAEKKFTIDENVRLGIEHIQHKSIPICYLLDEHSDTFMDQF